MKCRLFLSVVLCISMVFTFVACGGGNSGEEVSNGVETAEDVVFNWKLQNSYGPGDQTWDFQMPMLVDAIEEATDGRILIEVFQPGTLCEPEQAPASVAEGLFECAMSTAGDTGILVPAAYAEQGIPYFWETQIEMYDTYYNFGLLDFLRGEYDSANLYFGMAVPNGKYALMTTFPINSVDDVKGKKIRAVSSWAKFVESLGGAPVSSITGGEIYQAIKLGTVDGCIYTFAELQGSGLCEVVDYVTVQPPSGSGYVNFIINKDAWNALPEDLQSDVNQAMQDVFPLITDKCIEADLAAEDFALEAGVELLPLDETALAAFQKAGLATADKVAKDHPEAAPGLDIVRKWHKETKE